MFQISNNNLKFRINGIFRAFAPRVTVAVNIGYHKIRRPIPASKCERILGINVPKRVQIIQKEGVPLLRKSKDPVINLNFKMLVEIGFGHKLRMSKLSFGRFPFFIG